MNSRPLFPLADDGHDLHELTPVRFIVQKSFLSPPWRQVTRRTPDDPEIGTNSRVTDSFLDKIQG